MIAILGKGFISSLISSNNRNLQLLRFQKIYSLSGGFYETCDREAATTRGCHLGRKLTVLNLKFRICFFVNCRNLQKFINYSMRKRKHKLPYTCDICKVSCREGYQRNVPINWLPVPSCLIARLVTILRASVGNGTCYTM